MNKLKINRIVVVLVNSLISLLLLFIFNNCSDCSYTCNGCYYPYEFPYCYLIGIFSIAFAINGLLILNGIGWSGDSK